MRYINIHDATLHSLDPPSLLALPQTFEMIFSQYHRHPEYKTLGPDGKTFECAVTVSDEWQGKGLGYLLMRHLIEVARQRGIKRMYSVDSAQNQKMRALATDLGFTRKIDPEYPSEATFTLEL